MKIARILLIASVLGMISGVLVSAYPPVILAGVRGYMGIGSSDPGAPTVAVGPQLDIDFRRAIGDSLYLSSWYDGSLWFSPGSIVPTDRNVAGLLVGGSFGFARVEVRASGSVSSAMGDAVFTAEPQWGATLTVPFTPVVALETDYSGFYRFEDATDRDEFHTHVRIRILVDPSISLGFSAEAGAAMTGFPEKFVLDSAGAATSVARNDQEASVGVGLEGFLGYFSLWSLVTRAGAVRSNANRYLSDADLLEPGSLDRYVAHLGSAISSNPTSSIGLSGSLDVDGSLYTQRAILDTSGMPLSEFARVLRVSGTADLDWSPDGRMYVTGGIGGGYALSNDQEMTGWSASATLGLQLRF